MNDFVRLLSRPVTAGEIGQRLQSASLIGDADRLIRAIGALSSDAPGVLAFCDAANASDRLQSTRATVIFVPSARPVLPGPEQTLIAVDDVRAAFIDAVCLLLPGADRPFDPAPGVDASARIDDSASVSPGACIGADVVIGPRSRVGPGVVIHADTQIGDDCVIGPGAVIGTVGLAYHDRKDGRRVFFPHLAGVRIGNRVDVGAHTCICRGMLSHTVIGDDVKIGSLVYVSHGVVIEARAWLSAGTAIAGHARIAADALLGIGSVVIDNVVIDAGARIGGGSVVTKHTQPGETLYGVPAHPVASMRRFGP